MSYITWLLEQIDLEAPSSRFAKLCWQDINNGCAHIRFSVKQWQEHFSSKHTESAEQLITLLFNSYAEYLREVEGKIVF